MKHTDAQYIKNVRFNNSVSRLYTLILFLGSLRLAPLRFTRTGLLLFGWSALFSLLHELYCRQLAAGKEPRWSLLLIPGIASFNIFVFLTGLWGLRKTRSTGSYYLSYAILVDLAAMAVTATNLFKPFVSDTFLLTMGVMMVLFFIHLALFLMHPHLIKKHAFTKALLILLALSSFTGNILAALSAWSFYKDAQRGAARSRRTDVREKLQRNQAALLGLFFIVLLLVLALTSPYGFSYRFAINNDYANMLQKPSLRYPFGTDNVGRDILSRIVFGTRISLLVGLLATLLPFVIGGILGAISGYFGRRTDNLIMRALDVLYAIPGMLLAIAIVASFGASTQNLIIALSLGAIPSYARTMRASVMQVANYEYIQAASALGQSPLLIIVKHVLPNSMAPMIVRSTLTIGTAVISTSSLSFLGLGVASHIPEWGNILRNGSQYLETHSHLAIYSGLAIILLVLSFNFLGDGLRDAFDPKLS
ncbi:MAG TPA: ABC transporter permease [Tissierellia bacterium]|nr:ABC transporter permease [Tissierellia bacterium]